MHGKTNKNLFLPDWLIELLDAEGDRYGGPGLVAATGIWHFCRMTDAQKIEAVKDFTVAEVRRAYRSGATEAEGLAAIEEMEAARKMADAAEAASKARAKRRGHKARAAG